MSALGTLRTIVADALELAGEVLVGLGSVLDWADEKVDPLDGDLVGQRVTYAVMDEAHFFPTSEMPYKDYVRHAPWLRPDGDRISGRDG